MKQQRMLTHGLILGAFCLGFGIVLAASNPVLRLRRMAPR